MIFHIVTKMLFLFLKISLNVIKYFKDSPKPDQKSLAFLITFEKPFSVTLIVNNCNCSSLYQKSSVRNLFFIYFGKQVFSYINSEFPGEPTRVEHP